LIQLQYLFEDKGKGATKVMFFRCAFIRFCILIIPVRLFSGTKEVMKS